MARSVGNILLLIFALSFARADEEAYFREEYKKRWNTPPELTPESLVKMSDNRKSQARLLSLIPVTATISLNAGQHNAHSVSLGARLEGISLSESNSYNHPGGYEADGVGQATATSFEIIENGRAPSGAASSIGTSQTLDEYNTNSRQYQNRPTWSNISPSNEYNSRHLNRPTLTVSKSHKGIRPVTLNINAHGTSRREQKPMVHIYKWQPNRRPAPRPSLSIEHRELRPHSSWNRQTHTSKGLQIGISSSSSPQKFPASDPASRVNPNPLSLAFSLTTQPQHTSGNVQGHIQNSPSFAHRNVGERTQSNAFSGYVPEGSSNKNSFKGTSNSGHQSVSSEAQANIHQIASNGHRQEIALFEGGSLVKFPDDTQSQITPSRNNGEKAVPKQGHADSDIFSDLTQAVGELFDLSK